MPYRDHTERLIRNRARRRALAELGERHAEEWEELAAQYLPLVRAEHERLVQREAKGSTVAVTVITSTRAPLLRPGRHRTDETIEDRIDVGRCPDCRRSHDRGHECPYCHGTPTERPHSFSPSKIDKRVQTINEVTALLSTGRSILDIARSLNYAHPHHLATQLEMWGRDDLARRFKGRTERVMP